MTRTSRGIAFDRTGPSGATPILLVHAGIADRRMWDPQWPALAVDRDTVRLDLTGFGESDSRPDGRVDHVAEVIDTLTELGIERAHLVGASYGAGIITEVALTRPELAASLLLSAPGGSLMSEPTSDLTAFFEAENRALADGDLAAAVEANVATWVDGPGQPNDRVPPEVRAAVARMQRRAFDIDLAWGELESAQLDPPALARLGEIEVPTLVLVGDAGRRRASDSPHATSPAGIPGARQVSWPEVAHLPSMEQPDRFLQLLREHLG